MCVRMYVCMYVFSLTLEERYAEQKSTIHNETERIQTDEKSVNKLCSWRSTLFSIMKIDRAATTVNILNVYANMCKFISLKSKKYLSNSKSKMIDSLKRTKKLTCKICSRCSIRRISTDKLMSAHPNSATYFDMWIQIENEKTLRLLS